MRVNKRFCYPRPHPPLGADPAGAAQRDFIACVRARESLVFAPRSCGCGRGALPPPIADEMLCNL